MAELLQAMRNMLPAAITNMELIQAQNPMRVVDEHIKNGRFQHSLAFVAAMSSLVSGLEVAYEHYKGSYGNRAMYTPLITSTALTGAAIGGVFSASAARTWMRWTSAATLINGAVGFGFHIRGIQRKPGGWRLPLTNIIMGPPLFAPLLFGTAAYLGFIASYLRPEGQSSHRLLDHPRYTGWRRELHEGEFQKHMCAVAALWTVFSGAEAWYSHYKSRFRIRAQWIPVLLSPIQLAACAGGIYSEAMTRRFLPASSAITMAAGGVGFFYHARGIARRPGGLKHWVYNILYGPPVFAPLLFSACGMLGLLASILRRERRSGGNK